jgi:hypothetical protein
MLSVYKTLATVPGNTEDPKAILLHFEEDCPADIKQNILFLDHFFDDQLLIASDF